MVVGDQPLVYICFNILIYSFGTGLATVFTTGGGGVQDPTGLLRAIEPDAYYFSVCTGWSLCGVKPCPVDLDLIIIYFYTCYL